VPPLGVVVVDRVVVWVVVERVGVEIDSSGTVVVELPELSAATMIRPTPSPITRATRMPMIQRVRLSTGADSSTRLGDLRG
jgi:hypothetical protein